MFGRVHCRLLSSGVQVLEIFQKLVNIPTMCLVLYVSFGWGRRRKLQLFRRMTVGKNSVFKFARDVGATFNVTRNAAARTVLSSNLYCSASTAIRHTPRYFCEPRSGGILSEKGVFDLVDILPVSRIAQGSAAA